MSSAPSSGLVSLKRTEPGISYVVSIDFRKRGYENVKKWTAKLDLFSKKYVVIPVNESYYPI
jgi:hypothetical protein